MNGTTSLYQVARDKEEEWWGLGWGCGVVVLVVVVVEEEL